MRTLLFVLPFAYITFAVPIQEQESFQYPRFIQFPDGNGIMQEVDLEAEPDYAVLDNVNRRDAANNLYLLFTRRNPTNAQSLILNDDNSILNSNFNPELPTIVIIHGWLSDQYSGVNPTIREAYLAKSDVNVIVVDWSHASKTGYVTAVRAVPAIGRGVGQFLGYLSVVSGASFDNMHIIGFSLGGHVIGSAGREVGGRIARVTGLDPAGPLWNLNSDRLDSSAGVYVEAIHTDGGVAAGGLGIGSAIADVDFFPNGGTWQPGCLTNSCNHDRAYQYFASSIIYEHLIGSECSSSLQITLNTCSGQQLALGTENLRKTGSGMYRVDTGRNYPY